VQGCARWNASSKHPTISLSAGAFHRTPLARELDGAFVGLGSTWFGEEKPGRVRRDGEGNPARRRIGSLLVTRRLTLITTLGLCCKRSRTMRGEWPSEFTAQPCTEVEIRRCPSASLEPGAVTSALKVMSGRGVMNHQMNRGPAWLAVILTSGREEKPIFGNWTNPASQIRNRNIRLRPTVQFKIFGFRI